MCTVGSTATASHTWRCPDPKWTGIKAAGNMTSKSEASLDSGKPRHVHRKMGCGGDVLVCHFENNISRGTCSPINTRSRPPSLSINLKALVFTTRFQEIPNHSANIGMEQLRPKKFFGVSNHLHLSPPRAVDYRPVWWRHPTRFSEPLATLLYNAYHFRKSGCGVPKCVGMPWKPLLFTTIVRITGKRNLICKWAGEVGG